MDAETSLNCNGCHHKYNSIRALRAHQKSHAHVSLNSSKTFSCWTCNKRFLRDCDLLKHRRICHRSRYHLNRDIDASVMELSNEDDISLPPATSILNLSTPTATNHHTKSSHLIQTGEGGGSTIASEVENLYARNYAAMESYYKTGSCLDVQNVRVDNDDMENIRRAIVSEYGTRINTMIKANASPGCILKHKSTGELRYYHSSSNNFAILQHPKLISSLDDFHQFANEIFSTDIMEWAQHRRPDTSWMLHSLTNITFYYYKLVNTGRVGTASTIPPFLSNHKYVLTLDKETAHNTVYTDKLCFFRALSIVMMCSCKGRCRCKRPQERFAKELYKIWNAHHELDVPPKDFSGVKLKDLLELEAVFQISITVYALKEDDVGTCLWSSNSSFPTKLNLCLHGNHFCLVKDPSIFVKSFVCRNCERSFTRACNLKRHRCEGNRNRLTFPTGCYRPQETIFDILLQRAGIDVELERKIYPYRITFDIETFMDRQNLPVTPSSDKLNFISNHKLMSISVCSNVPNFDQPNFIVSSGSTDDVIDQFLSYLERIQEEAYNLMQAQFSDVLHRLEKATINQERIERAFEDESFSNQTTYKSRSLHKVWDKFQSYLAVIPVIGFNSGSYDLNIMKGPLLKNLHENGKIIFTIKRQSRLQCIQTDRFKFLDMMNYLAPGTSYAKYLKAFDIPTQKGFFPYEYVDGLEKLEETSLPPHEAFYSNLTKSNISSDECELCQQIWKDNDMTTLRDFLRWYNNLDVVPFLHAISKQSQIYSTRGIDMFKDCISIPGVAVRWKFSELAEKIVDIPLISSAQQDLYRAVKDNIVGGPSIIFHRHHEKGQTKIRERTYGIGAKSTHSVLGYDANALYLWSMMQEMPTGSPIRRSAIDQFRPKFSEKYGRMAWSWLEYTASMEGKYIQHKYNSGEFRVGQHGLPVDGYCSETNTVYQFHGCSFHGHVCHLTLNQTHHPYNNKSFNELFSDTKKKENYVKSLGYTLVIMRECEWFQILKSNPDVKHFSEDLQYRTMSSKSSMTEAQILDSMLKDEWFGLIECDISVPDHLYDKFSEMSPIFKNIAINRSHLSGHMKDFVMEQNLLKTPQRSLIGSMFGEKILLMTPLAKWYLEQGLVITNVYQIVQYKPERCFETFGESVSQARREGDIDPSKSLLADTSKLIGNSVYGKMITNKEAHKTTDYKTDIKKVSHAIARNEFNSLEEIDEDFYEIISDKKSILLDIPVVLGFCVLQYAKLRMLQFYYDCIDKYIERRDFEYCEMDTDSAYMALSDDLPNLIKPQLKKEFWSNYGDWFPRLACSEHRTQFIKDKLADLPWCMAECCEKVNKFDKRTPGLFKEEFSGIGIISLNSKTYYCWTESSVGDKYTSKGLNKRQNQLTKEQFRAVLQSKTSVSGCNRGIMKRDNKLFTYSQSRNGLTYVYIKRFIQDDGVSTLPLNI